MCVRALTATLQPTQQAHLGSAKECVQRHATNFLGHVALNNEGAGARDLKHELRTRMQTILRFNTLDVHREQVASLVAVRPVGIPLALSAQQESSSKAALKQQ